MDPKNPPFVPSLVGAVHENMNRFLYIPPSLFPPIPYHSIPTPAEGQLAYSPSTPHANTQHRSTPLTDTSVSPNQGFEPGIAFINTPPLTGYPVKEVSSGLNSASHMRCEYVLTTNAVGLCTLSKPSRQPTSCSSTSGRS